MPDPKPRDRASLLSVLLLLAALLAGGAMVTTASVQLDDQLTDLTTVQVVDVSRGDNTRS